jgi:hypothetical protein
MPQRTSAVTASLHWEAFPAAVNYLSRNAGLPAHWMGGRLNEKLQLNIRKAL